MWRKHNSMDKYVITSSYYLLDQLFSTMAVPNHVVNLCSYPSWIPEKELKTKFLSLNCCKLSIYIVTEAVYQVFLDDGVLDSCT